LVVVPSRIANIANIAKIANIEIQRGGSNDHPSLVSGLRERQRLPTRGASDAVKDVRMCQDSRKTPIH
jgi:hypothetical protein